MRNPNNFGSCYKMKGNRHRPWVARITTGWETVTALRGRYAGQEVRRQKFKVIGYYPTKDEAIDALVLYRNGYITAGDDITLEELYTEWSALAYNPKHITNSTINNYKMAWGRISHLGHQPIRNLRTKHWQEIFDATELGFSAQTKMRTLISQLYTYAADNEIVKHNYAKSLRLVKEDVTEKEIFTDFEIKKLEDNQHVPGVDLILFLIYTGFRITEALTLTQFNVDMDQGLIRGGAKSAAGKNRIVPIHPRLMPILKKQLDRQGETVWCREDGKPMTGDKCRKKVFYPALKSLGIKERSPHTCRHTCATLLARAGVDTIYIQRILGHSSYSFTADVYSHPQVAELKTAISKL